ncbi:MAG: Alanine--tRNA ligase, partial [Alphaproteobacteria bacterium MarineAlpha5_Bin8]
MNSSQIRDTFLSFFKKHNHKIIHSSPLVPENDPTLMFANSGMVQFKNIFTGKEQRNYKRAVTAQKCVRAGGKHNDLENVGYTARHHTFFEMLGNFSFGDYFKDQAIELAWNLITKEFGISKNRLLVTVFSEDQEAYKYWKSIAGLSEDKIIKINTSDNFWSMGDTGPCGPCSEIFYDHGDKYDGGPPGSSDEDGDRFIEIWNLVFMQFEQINLSERINLPKPSIDTGMGLERITALIQGTNDNYSTDLFLPLINRSIELCNNGSYDSSPSHRVIADHLRSSAFLIADGVMPSNEGRGYVLRRIMRRGMRHAHSLGNKEPIFHKIFPTFLEGIKQSYPELERASDLIINTLITEETKFKETVEKGIKILDEEILKSPKTLDGEIAFKLYDTYGFPIDLTQDYLKSKKIGVDLNSFNIKMEEQKKRARQNWKGTGDIEDNKIWYNITENISPTEFLGYEQTQSECSIISLVCNNKSVNKLTKDQEAIIILNQTPFYGESGGQVGDSGKINNDNLFFQVTNTTKIFGNYYLHWGKVIDGKCSINDTVIASINLRKRNLIKSNHSSTHLLHASLRKILGKHVSQKGSLVNEEKLRFDFSHNQIIENNNLIEIENLVKSQIEKKLPINVKISNQKKAIEEGAMALFGEKYGDEVRVVTIGENEKNFSIELCGGTHVNNTSDIIDFKIISQSSVASGIRRIEAITNLTVNTYLVNQQEINLKNENDNIKNIKLIVDKIIELDPKYIFKLNTNLNSLTQLKEIKKTYEKKLEIFKLKSNSQNLVFEKINDINFIYLIAEDYPIHSLKN